MQENKKIVIVIAGPTAVGKTSVAIEVAKHFTAQIISADSRQCFKELKIGVARPSEKELMEVPHYFIASHSIHQKVTAASFEDYALNKTIELFQSHDVVVMAGGTGLYINAFCQGMDEIPDVPESVHDEVKTAYHQKGIEWLQEEIKKSDPQFWEKGEIKNPQRLMRALEVIKATGRSVFDFRKGEKKKRDFKIIKVALHLPKEELHRNINLRVDTMMDKGLLKEVESLLPYQHLNALQTVGYKEIFHFLNNEISLAEAIETIKKNTRQYAKRQLTWFKKDEEYKWMPPDANAVIDFLRLQVQ